MRHPDIGDETVGGLGDAAQVGDFARVVGAHLHDGDFGAGCYGEQRERHADVVVEVALGEGHAVLRLADCRLRCIK